MTKAEKQLDKEIERLYYKHANNRYSIDIMKINDLFKAAKQDHQTGMPLEDAVIKAISTFCEKTT